MTLDRDDAVPLVFFGLFLVGAAAAWASRLAPKLVRGGKPTDEQVTVLVLLCWLFLPLLIVAAILYGTAKSLAYLGRGVRDWLVWYNVRARAVAAGTSVDPDLEAARREVNAIAPEGE